MATNNNIHIDSQSVIDALAHARESVTDLRPIMADIGETVRSNIMLGFRETKSPDGINWAALKPSTIENRRQGSSVPLNDTGQLKASITFNASSNYVEIGTNKPYAALMNFGGTKAQFPNLWGNIPARQFFPSANLPDTWTSQIIDIVNHHLSG